MYFCSCEPIFVASTAEAKFVTVPVKFGAFRVTFTVTTTSATVNSADGVSTTPDARQPGETINR